MTTPRSCCCKFRRRRVRRLRTPHLPHPPPPPSLPLPLPPRIPLPPVAAQRPWRHRNHSVCVAHLPFKARLQMRTKSPSCRRTPSATAPVPDPDFNLRIQLHCPCTFGFVFFFLFALLHVCLCDRLVCVPHLVEAAPLAFDGPWRQIDFVMRRLHRSANCNIVMFRRRSEFPNDSPTRLLMLF